MLTLPPEFVVGGIEATVERLKLPQTRAQLREAFAHPRFPIETIRLASLPHPDWKEYEGKLLLDAANEATDGPLSADGVIAFVCDMLIATDMAAGCVIRHFAERQESDIIKLMKHPVMMAGSDGIYVGGCPHPRGTGCFARYLGEYVRNGTWSLEEAVSKLSWHGARRFGLTDRGQIHPGFAADLVMFDPATIADQSTFENGKALAVGVRDVLVNGTFVLRDGQRTEHLPGRGLKRTNSEY
jgi:N-acyl-D-amino-acid deacylase